MKDSDELKAYKSVFLSSDDPSDGELGNFRKVYAALERFFVETGLTEMELSRLAQERRWIMAEKPSVPLSQHPVVDFLGDDPLLERFEAYLKLSFLIKHSDWCNALTFKDGEELCDLIDRLGSLLHCNDERQIRIVYEEMEEMLKDLGLEVV